MPSTLKTLTDKGLIQPPKWLPDNVHYETMMGSVAYGVSGDTSDVDIYGFAIPPKEMVFPHLAGEIEGFSTKGQRFDQFDQHHIEDADAAGGKGKSYDFALFNIVKYFRLLMENNPNAIDSLFTPDFCVLHITRVGQMMREQRNLFLHKGCWHKFKGYAHSQLHKMEIKERGTEDLVKFENEHGIDHRTTFQEVLDEKVRREKAGANPELPLGKLNQQVFLEYHRLYDAGMAASKRFQPVKVFGFDVKFAYHVVRLLDEVEQILTVGTIDLQRNREQMKLVRRGEMKPDEIKKWYTDREPHLETLYNNSNVVPHKPPEDRIKQILLDCLESHYGSLSKMGVVVPGAAEAALKQIADIVEKNRSLIS